MVTNSDQLPPLRLSPSTEGDFVAAMNAHQLRGRVAFAMEVLGAHPDPIVQAVHALMRDDVVPRFESALSAEAMVPTDGVDSYDLILAGAGPFLIGSTAACDVQIAVDDYVRGEAITIVRECDKWIARSETTARPGEVRYDSLTWRLNGHPVAPNTSNPVLPGDQIQIGRSVINMHAASENQP